MVERVRSHKRLRGISAVFASAFLAASCSGSSPSPSETPTPTIRVLPTETPIFTTTPEITPIFTPEPTPIVEKTVDQQAKEVMFNFWINKTLNTGVQEKKEYVVPGTSYIQQDILKVEATRLNDWQNQENLILNDQQSSEILQISWAGGNYKHEKSSKDGKASKYFGQIEINNAQMINRGVFPLSDADVANGITWHGLIQINYIERFHSKIYWMAQGNYEKLKTWTIKFDNNDLPEFTPWYPTSYEGELTLQNGKWNLKQPQSSSRQSSASLISGFTVPYDTKEELGTICANSCEASFQTIDIK